MARDQPLRVLGWFRLILRVILLLAGLGLLGVTAYVGTKWKFFKPDASYAEILVAALFSIATDIFGIFAIFRLPSFIPITAVLDIFIFVLAGVGLSILLIFDIGLPWEPPAELNGWMAAVEVALILLLVIVCGRIVSLILCAIPRCCCSSGRRSKAPIDTSRQGGEKGENYTYQ